VIRTLIADDHPIVRSGLKLIAREHEDISVVQEAASAREVLPAIRSTHIDVVVLDVQFPDGSALDIMRDIRREFPRLPVVILTMHSEEELGTRAMSAGASAYLHKENAPELLVEAIRTVHAGRRFITPKLADALAAAVARDQSDVRVALSGRESLILRLLVSGKTVTEIAKELSISVKTVSTYRSRMLDKLGVRSTAELIRYALVNKLVS
jgi:DNA-binding NarL/FixJ family response regulator